MHSFVLIQCFDFFGDHSKAANVLVVLGAVASEALDLTGFYYSGKRSVMKKKSNQIRRTDTSRYASNFCQLAIFFF